MTNVINRAQYGNLGCLWGVFKSRFSKAGNSINLSDLKVSESYNDNPINVCSGRQKFPKAISEKIDRNYYCPFLRNRTDNRICQWVHSKKHDPQKSKPVGQTAIVLNLMGLAELERTKKGVTKSIKWSEQAGKISNLEWGHKKLDSFLQRNARSYGPLLALAYYLFKDKRTEIKSSDLRDKLMILPSNEEVSTTCSKGTKTCVKIWDGNTSSDAATRTTCALLCLAGSVGFVRPSGFPEKKGLNPHNMSDWLIQRAVNGKKSFPRKYFIQNKKVENLFDGLPKVKRGINYIDFLPKPTDRNRGNRCRCCRENVVNNARNQFGAISKNRKMLLIEALRKASKKRKKVDLKKLAKVSLNYSNFYFCKNTQLSTLLNIERKNAIFYGFPNKIRDESKLKPLVTATKDAFGEIPYFIKKEINEILSKNNIFV